MLDMEKTMPEKDLMSSAFTPYILVGVISIWGGIASYIRKLRSGVFIRFSFAELVGEIVISGFVGIVTFLICQSYNVDLMLTAAFTGICAHMGSRAIFVMETAVDRVMQRWALQRLGGKRDV